MCVCVRVCEVCVNDRESVCVCVWEGGVCVCVCLPTFPHNQDAKQGQFFKRSLPGLKPDFSFSLTDCYTKIKELSLPYYFNHRENC